VVSGAEGWKDIKQFGDEKIEWLRQYRAYQHGIPVDDTIARLIRAIEPEKMNLPDMVKNPFGNVSPTRNTSLPLDCGVEIISSPLSSILPTSAADSPCIIRATPI
jgi:hypothetical protein